MKRFYHPPQCEIVSFTEDVLLASTPEVTNDPFVNDRQWTGEE